MVIFKLRFSLTSPDSSQIEMGQAWLSSSASLTRYWRHGSVKAPAKLKLLTRMFPSCNGTQVNYFTTIFRPPLF